MLPTRISPETVLFVAVRLSNVLSSLIFIATWWDDAMGMKAHYVPLLSSEVIANDLSHENMAFSHGLAFAGCGPLTGVTPIQGTRFQKTALLDRERMDIVLIRK